MNAGMSVAESPGRRMLTRALWVLQGVLLIGLLLAPLLGPLVAPVICATLLLVFGLRHALQAGQLSQRLFELGFALGNVLFMVYANAGYVWFTDLPQYGDHTDSMWLTNGLIAASMVGGQVAHVFVSRPRPEPSLNSAAFLERWETFVITGVIHLVSTVLIYVSAANTRWDPGEATDATTLALGTGRIVHLFFFVAGYQLRPGLLRPRNLALIVTGLGLSLGAGLLRGYREAALLNLILFAYGAFLKARVEARLRMPLAFMAAALVPIALIYMQAVGEAREEFAHKGLGERLNLTAEQLGSDEQSPGHGGMEDLWARLFPLPGQDVIARLKGMGHYAGFEHFDRLLYVMVPKFIVPEKETTEIGPEVLARDFQYYTLGETHRVPITLVADCYRRGGWPWIIVVGLLTGAWLRCLVGLTRLMARGPLLEAAVALIALKSLRLYPCSVTGLIGQVTWYWLKETAMFAAVGLLVVLVCRATGPGRATTRPAQLHPRGVSKTSLGL